MNSIQAPSSQNAPFYIQACNLDVGYKDETIVANLNIKVERGQALALVGANGSGKTTLLKTLAGLVPPVKGQLEILGNPPGKSPKRLAYLSQFHTAGSILPMQAIDVVRMGRYANHGLIGRMTREDDDLIESALARMGIKHLAHQTLRSLSGGQQQRVYIAQLLARQADLLILDEPTAGLDAGGKEIYKEALDEEQQRGASIVVATHDIQEALHCDQTMILARKLLAYGKSAEIITPQVLMKAFGITSSLSEMLQSILWLNSEHLEIGRQESNESNLESRDLI